MEGNDEDNEPKRCVSRVWALGEFFYYYFLRLLILNDASRYYI